MVTRVLYFAYGCAAYLIFLATFLYAIAFVGGFAVPTTLDGPATTPLSTALAVNVLLLGVSRCNTASCAPVVQALVDADRPMGD